MHIPLFTFQKLRNTSMGDVCSFNCHLVLASMLKPIFNSTPNPHSKQSDLPSFGSQ
jgi:hypothetical protein